jgi:predicted enzyme related to lactoylglutathione lyase
VNTGLPPVWMMYLPVGDLAESLRRVPAEGGRVIKTVEGKTGDYAYAAVQDPVGVFLALVPGHTSADA